MNQEEIKDKLQKEIIKTENLIEEYKSLSGPVEPDVAIGRISRMDAINNKSITEASLRQAREKLKNLREVLAQLGRDNFGVCRKCRQPIPLGRIIFRPESLYCVNCSQ